MAGIHKKRLILITFLIVGLGSATALILYALSKNINLFYTPTQLKESTRTANENIRVGGMVVKGSIVRKSDLTVQFVITDFKNQLNVEYKGILPDLFKEGQGVVAQGQWQENNQFKATQVLAKHDEKYMPPELNDLKKEIAAQ